MNTSQNRTTTTAPNAPHSIPVTHPAIKQMIAEVQKAVSGKNLMIFKILLAILASGHILLEDIPGVGKTTLALALSRTLSLSVKRIQFTPDVLPTDVTGFTVYNKETNRFEFKKGAAFCHLLLADEINRTSSKTQSALLELMEEGAVTIDGVTHPLPKPHIVIATQNPITCVGTQKLPESQMDRFLIRLSLGYPSAEHEVQLLKARHHANPLDEIRPVIDEQQLVQMRRDVENIYVSDALYHYVVSLTARTRNHPAVRLGISPRGTLGLLQLAKACAYSQGRDFLLPDDIHFVCKDVFCHRLILRDANGEPGCAEAIVSEILRSTPLPSAEALE